jgi:hypothetical protein
MYSLSLVWRFVLAADTCSHGSHGEDNLCLELAAPQQRTTTSGASPLPAVLDMKGVEMPESTVLAASMTQLHILHVCQGGPA